MAIIYTKHAKDMLVLRKIKKHFIKTCVHNPDKITSAREGKKIYFKDFGKNYLKLIVSEEDIPLSDEIVRIRFILQRHNRSYIEIVLQFQLRSVYKHSRDHFILVCEKAN